MPTGRPPTPTGLPPAGWCSELPIDVDGPMPFARWVVREKGEVELGNTACALCHTRVTPDGATIEGAQGNLPFDQIFADDIPNIPPPVMPLVLQVPVGAPWDVEGSARLRGMSIAELQQAWATVPPGVIARQGTSLFAPPAVPDLSGIEDRRYLDKTGLGRHRGIADVMRYAAMSQTLDVLGGYGGFVPDAADGRTRAGPGRSGFSGANDRYSGWFDARRLRDHYVPTGFKGAGTATRAVRGHPFGMMLSAEDKAALIAFLKTL